MCADVTQRLFVEFGGKLSLALITAVVLQERLHLVGASKTLDPAELETRARRTLQAQLAR